MFETFALLAKVSPITQVCSAICSVNITPVITGRGPMWQEKMVDWNPFLSQDFLYTFAKTL